MQYQVKGAYGWMPATESEYDQSKAAGCYVREGNGFIWLVTEPGDPITMESINAND